MKRILPIVAVLCLLLTACRGLHSLRMRVGDAAITLDSRYAKLPPDSAGHPSIGVAGVFAGMLQGRLAVIGGANFPNGLPKAGGKKVWHRTLSLFDGKRWEQIPDFWPQPVAYGISITLPQGVLCIGGCNSDSCMSACTLLQMEGGHPSLLSYPALPQPMANGCGALVGDSLVLVAGGQSTMQEYAATRRLYCLNLHHLDEGWQQCPAWPGGERGYGVAIGTADRFYLFSGRNYDKEEHWTVWSDGYCYNPSNGQWSNLECNIPVMAGCGCALNDSTLLFVGGRTPQSNVGVNFVRTYNRRSGTLSSCDLGSYPLPVTTTLVQGDDCIYIVSGEVAPGIRTPYIYRIVP